MGSLKGVLKSGDANAKSWAIREGQETLSKMLTEEDKIYQGYYLPQRDKVRSQTIPASNERIVLPKGDMDHADWNDPYGPVTVPKAKDLGQYRDPYGPGHPDSSDLGGDGTSWKPASEFVGDSTSWAPSSEFVGDIGLSEEKKDQLYTAGLVGFAILVGGVVLFDLTRKGAQSKIKKLVHWK